MESNEAREIIYYIFQTPKYILIALGKIKTASKRKDSHVKGNFRRYRWYGERIALVILLGDIMIILFSSCCLLKYDMMSEIMSPLNSRMRTLLRHATKDGSLLNLKKKKFRDTVCLITGNKLKFRKNIHIFLKFIHEHEFSQEYLYIDGYGRI